MVCKYVEQYAAVKAALEAFQVALVVKWWENLMGSQDIADFRGNGGSATEP